MLGHKLVRLSKDWKCNMIVDAAVLPLTERFEWNGRTIAHATLGEGPHVVFNHGTPFSSRVWAPYAAALADRFTVHLWDMPGYGMSSKHPDHKVDFDTQSHAFGALLDLWGVERPNVIAHDFGGAVAWREILVNGREYGSLFLVDPVSVPPIGSPFFKFVGENPQLAALPAFIHDAAVDAYIRGASATGFTEEELHSLRAPWTGPEGQPAFYKQITDFDEAFLAENEDRMSSVSCPVRLLWADEDEWIPLEYGERLANLIPGVEFSVVAGAGHLVQHDAPIALMAHLTDWLNRHAV